MPVKDDPNAKASSAPALVAQRPVPAPPPAPSPAPVLQSAPARSAAPEVSQGQFRERAFVARKTMPKEEILTGFRQVLALVNSWNEPINRMAASLKTEWLPFFRQAVEQVSGDGVDAHLSRGLGKPISGSNLSFAELLDTYAQIPKSTSKEELKAAGERVVARIAAALDDGNAQPISLKLLEKQFEGRLDLDEVLVLLTCTDEELTERLKRAIESMEVLRAGMRAGSGGPTGMLWNFSRLKAEKQLIEGEQKLRSGVGK